MAVSSAGNE